jgi:muramoyltetrapeptide carboxypeptidase
MPPALKPHKPVPQGGLIRIIAPANFVTESELVHGTLMLKHQRFQVEPCPHMFDREGQFAGADEVRARSLTEAFTDPSVDAIICARGGYGSPRILDLVDWAKIAKFPKPFVGYSDITAILNTLVFKCGMPAFHGPMVRDLHDESEADDQTLRGLLEALRGTYRDWPKLCEGAEVLAEGDAVAPIVGGNLTILASLAGTGTNFSANGAILLLEDVSEYVYRLDRALVQMRRAGMLDGVQGVIISDLVEVEDGNVPFGMTPHEMILSHFPGVPVIANMPAGHGPRKATFPLGIPVRMKAGPEGASLEYLGHLVEAAMKGAQGAGAQEKGATPVNQKREKRA